MTNSAALVSAPNKDQAFLKLVAVSTMIVDHVGVIFFPSQILFRVVGRIAFPLFCWGIVIGAERTRDWKAYALRMLALGVVSQPFYMLALTHDWLEFNVMATLLLGLLSIQGVRLRWYFSQYWMPALCLLTAAAFRMDYGWRGVLLILLMHFARDSRGGLAALMVSFCLFWGAGYSSMIPSGIRASLVLTGLAPINQALGEFLGLIRLQSLALLSLPFMVRETHSGLRLPAWLSYLAYPGHLLLLWLLSLLVR